MRIKNVLVADNNDRIRRELSHWLEQRGYTVRTAADGLEALEMLEAFLPELIIVDRVMPGIDGAKLCRVIRGREQFAGVCLIMISSIAAEQCIDPANYGVDACIAKSGTDNLVAYLDMLLAELASHGTIREDRRLLGVKDVTKREVTLELLALQKHHELVLDIIYDGVVVLNHQGRITDINHCALVIFGDCEEEMLGGDFFSCLEPEQAEVLRRHVAGSDSDPLYLEAVNLNSRLVQLSLYPLHLQEALYFVVLLHDITKVRTTEETLRQTTENLRRSLMELQGTQDALVRQEKLASIGTLASGVAHEILNPLNIIGTIVQMLKMEDELPTEVHEQLDEVVVQIGRATKITSSLRNFSRQGQEIEIREVDLHALLDKTLELIQHDLKLDNIEVQKHYGQEVSVIAADPDQLAQVLINLIHNARDAMQDSKVRRLSFRTSGMGEMVGLAVADSGSGISADHLPKLFDPFFTTKEPGSGTGMGLPIVHSIIESMGGFIEVDSIPGRGTEFLILLPRSTTTA